MTAVNRPLKPSKRLSEISFEHEGAHVALVSKQQGGGAVGHNYALILKANKFSPEAIQKMQSIRVTLELPDFLEKFFHVYGTDAEVLARVMGWVPEEDDEEDDEYDWEKERRDYIEEKLASFEIMKAAKDDLTILADLDEKQYLRLLRDQSLVEKAFRKMEREAKKSETAAATAAEGTTEAVNKSVEKGKVEPSVKQEKTMEQVEELQKALDAQKEALEKALATVAAFEAEKKEMLIKNKTAQITAVIQDEKISSILVKAALQLEAEEDFTAFVGAVKSMAEQVEKSALFKEQGVTAGEQKSESDNAVMNLLKSKYAKA